jgi:hypothetical protein
MRMVAHNPEVMTVDRPGEFWRPGVLWSIDGASATVRVGRVGGPYRDYTVETSALPPNCGIGHPIAVRFNSQSFAPIVAIEEGGWAPGCHPADQAAAVAADVFTIGIIPRRITREPEEKAWTWR